MIYCCELVHGEKDIVVPTPIAAAATVGVAAAPVAAVEAFERAHSFERKFWEFISNSISDIGEGKAAMSIPTTLTH